MPRPTPKGRKPQTGAKPFAARKGPKSFKADGTPKNRWSDSRRTAEGHGARRPGAKPWESRDDRAPRKFDRDDRPARSNDRDDRPARSFDRDDRAPRKFDRDDRPARKFDRDDRAPRKFDRDDRPARSFDRDDRAPRKFDRDDRPARSDSRGRNFAPYTPAADEQPARRGYFGRDDRGASQDRGERRPFNRDDRPQRSFDRDDRAPRKFDRDDRPARKFDRDDRPARKFDRDERPRGDYKASRPVHTEPRQAVEPRYQRKPWEKGDRPERRFDDRGPRKFDREDRPQRSFDRSDRPARTFDRDDRPQRSFDRSDRPARSFDGDRKPWQRDDRGPRSFNRDDRGSNSEANADQMSWEATDLGELDASGVDTTEGFAALGVPPIIVAALDKQGITTPFPIQAATIPDAIAGRDVLGRGQTGSGKTLGFGLPMLTRISTSEGTGKAPRGLVLVPTRELALQCADVLAPLAKSLRLELTLIAGGMSYAPQLKAFDRGVDIVVATPGRLIDLLEQGAVDLSQVQVTVLDEADHMADLGFMPAVTTLLDTVPADGQRLLFSATLDHAVDRIVKKYLHDPVTHEVDSGRATVTTMVHQLLHVLPHDKNAITAEIANREGRSVLFCRTQMGTNRVAEQLRAAGVMAGALHGGLTQGARTRILAAFKDGTVPVLVATDVAARGIHVDDVSLVLEIDPPMSSKDYLHRAGRTARAGEKGVVASIVLPHQRRTMQRIAEQAGVKVEPLPVRPGDEALAEATGARPVEAAPIEESDYERLIAPKKSARGPRQGGGGRGFAGGRGGYRGDRDRGGRGGFGGGDRGGYRGNRDENPGWRRDR